MSYQHKSSRFIESVLAGLTCQADLVINVDNSPELSNIIEDAGVDAAIIISNEGNVQEAIDKLPLTETILKRVEGKGKTVGQGHKYKWWLKTKEIGKVKWVLTGGEKKLVTCRVVGINIVDMVNLDGLSIQKVKYVGNGKVFRR